MSFRKVLILIMMGFVVFIAASVLLIVFWYQGNDFTLDTYKPKVESAMRAHDFEPLCIEQTYLGYSAHIQGGCDENDTLGFVVRARNKSGILVKVKACGGYYKDFTIRGGEILSDSDQNCPEGSTRFDP